MTDISSPNAMPPAGQSTASPAGDVYTTTLADPAGDAERILALWRVGLPQDGMPDAKLKWYYRNNPEGIPLFVFLHHAGSPDAVGVAAVGPRQMRFGAETLKAGALVDFVTNPEHRTFFPAIFLQKELLRLGLDTHSILFGFPNAKSLAIVRRIGYRCIGQMVRRTRVLRSSAYLAKYLPGWLSRVAGAAIDGLRSTAMSAHVLVNGGFQSQWQDRPDAAFDDLWQRSVEPGVVIGVRNATFLTWRFVNAPSKSFRFFTLVSSTDQRLFAYAVCAADAAVLRVHDFFVDANAPSAGTRLWLDLSREARRLGYASLSIEFLGSERQQRQLGAAGFLVNENRPVYALVASRSDAACTLPTETSTWYLTLADDD